MVEINKELYEQSKRIDPFYVLELVNQINNDAELGSQIREYVQSIKKQ